MKLPVIYWYTKKGVVYRLIHIHTGFDDRSLYWSVDGKIMDFLFLKIRPMKKRSEYILLAMHVPAVIGGLYLIYKLFFNH